MRCSHLCFKYKALSSFTNYRYLVIAAALSCVQSPDKYLYTGPRLLLPAAISSLKLWLTVICRSSKHVCYSTDLASGQRKPLKKQISSHNILCMEHKSNLGLHVSNETWNWIHSGGTSTSSNRPRRNPLRRYLATLGTLWHRAASAWFQWLN